MIYRELQAGLCLSYLVLWFGSLLRNVNGLISIDFGIHIIYVSFPFLSQGFFYLLNLMSRHHYDWTVIFFFALWQIHGMFCMIPNDNTTKCDYMQVAVFWKYFLFSGIVFVFERILREVRSRHRTYISKIVRKFLSLPFSSAAFTNEIVLLALLRWNRTSRRCNWSSNKKRKNKSKSRTIYLYKLSWNFIFSMASFHFNFCTWRRFHFCQL